MVGDGAVAVGGEELGGGDGAEAGGGGEPEVVDAAVAGEEVGGGGVAGAEDVLEGVGAGDLEDLFFVAAGFGNAPEGRGLGLDVEVAADEGAGGVGGLFFARPGEKAVELGIETVLGPGEVGGEYVEQAGVGEAYLGHDDAAGVDGVGIGFVGDVAGVGVDEGVPREDRQAFAPAVEADVRPVGVDVVGGGKVGVDDVGGVLGPVAGAAVPGLGDFLEADEVDALFGDGFRDGLEFAQLVVFLPRVEVQGQDAQVAAPGPVVEAARVVPQDAAAPGADFGGVLDGRGVADRQARGPDAHARAVGVARGGSSSLSASFSG